jgi:hypothetical protein
MSEIGNLIAQILAALFGLSAVLHLAAPGFVRHVYQRWAFRARLLLCGGLAQAMAALFLAVHQTRVWGGFLAALILFVTVVTLLNRRKYLYAVARHPGDDRARTGHGVKAAANVRKTAWRPSPHMVE